MNKVETFMKPKMTFGDILRFTPYAWAKILYMRDRGPTEVAGFCVTITEDPLLVTDFFLVKQKCTETTFDLDIENVIDYRDKMMDQGVPPWACMNILAHTHPNNSPTPSGVDENNFVDAFSHPNWAIMFIVAKGGKTYCRLKVNVGPGVVKEIKVTIDWSTTFDSTDFAAWNMEYIENITCSRGFASQPTQYSDPTKQDVGNLDFNWSPGGYVEFFNNDNDQWYFYDPITLAWYEEDVIGDTGLVEIDTPKSPWVAAAIQWAKKYEADRIVAMES